jgi:hypothetical protein
MLIITKDMELINGTPAELHEVVGIVTAVTALIGLIVRAIEKHNMRAKARKRERFR